MRTAIIVAGMMVAATLATAADDRVRYIPGSTQKLAQITGDIDLQTGATTGTQTASRAHLISTDLGSTFEHNGRLVLLFGDTHGRREADLDALAFSDSTDARAFTMDIPVDDTGTWRAIAPSGLNHGAFCVASHGVSLAGSIYVLYTQGAEDNAADTMKRSFLIASPDDGASWTTLYQLPNGPAEAPRFVNGYFAKRDDFLYLFGSGKYRASSPTLARIEAVRFPARDAWMFFAGGDASGATRWSTSVEESATLFDHDVVGEFSCEWIEPLQRWVMLYNSAQPRGIVMRHAPQPWGPWSAGEVIFDPDRDEGYGSFMHVAGGRDTLSDPGREGEWGGEYGPYLIPRFITGDASRCELVYTMSTWNPYGVVLMRSVVTTGDPSAFGLANEPAPNDPSPRP